MTASAGYNFSRLSIVIVAAYLLCLCVATTRTSAMSGIERPSRVAQSDRRRLLNELTRLPYTYNILDPKYFRLLDSRDVATALLERQRRFMRRWESKADQDKAGMAGFPSGAEVEVVSFIPTKYIKSLLKRGQLNAHQVTHKQIHASTGMLRAEVEDLIINIHLEPVYSSDKSALVHYIRPKYGFVHFLKRSGVVVDPNTWLQYGKLIIVYRDSVKQRTTYTYGDSHCRIMVETPQRKHPSEPDSISDLRPPDLKHTHVPYVEAQVWGAIDMADIAEFRVPANQQGLVEQLKPAGLPIYTYDRDLLESIAEPIEESTVPIARLECLYHGDPVVLRKYAQVAAQRKLDLRSTVPY